MKKKKAFFLVVIFLSFSVLVGSAFAQQPPASQTAGGIARQKEDLQKKKLLEERITTDKTEAPGEATDELIPQDTGPKVLIKKINVEGATILSEDELQKIIRRYEGEELSLRDIQKVADLITDEYRVKGYATSRAYIPPQTIRDGVVLIRVVEGTLGSLQIRGNQHFKTSMLERKIGVETEGYFDYSALQQSLVYINQHPDRTARAVLKPGKTPGTTDVIIDVEDRLPIHVGIEFDNYGSRYIEQYRYSVILEHNNLLGHDDKLYTKLQQSDSSRLRLQQFRYLFPVNPTLELGLYYLRSKTKLGHEFKPLDARGKAEIIGLFASKALIVENDLDLRCSIGFDYKRVKNYLLGAQSSRDEIRMLKLGVDLDYLDKWGRTILVSELDIGIPGIMGGMAAKDQNASRAGAAGKFYKGVFYLFRLQPMPWESTILWKNSIQYTNYFLPASEEFQIGGATSVRGYPPAEFASDKGLLTSIEWSCPVYFISKELKCPFTGENIYDSLRFVVFYDWGTTHANRTTAGQEKHNTLKGYGFGTRLNIRDNLALRVEVGYPIGDTPSDGDHAHPWVELVWKF